MKKTIETKASGGITRRRVLKGTAAAIGAASVAGVSRFAIAQNKSIQVLTVADPFFYAMQGVADQFTKETGIEAKIESLSYEALQARLVSSFVSGQPDADVISVDNIWLGQYLESKWIKPLGELVQADKEVDVKDFVPEVIYSMNTWKGQLGTLPVAAYGQGVMYRQDFVEKMGLKIPSDGSWTWTQYADAVHKMQGQKFDGLTMAGSVVAGQQPAPIVHMFTQISASMGARWFKSFPEAPWDFEPRVDSPENLAAVEMFLDMYKNSPPEAVNYNWFDAGMRFAKGDIGMFYWWTPYFYLVKNAGYMTGKPSSVMDKYAVAALPKAPGVPQTVSLGGWSFGIPSSSAKRDDAWQFIKWSTSAATQKKMALYPKLNYQFSDFARRSLYADADIAKIYPYLGVQMAMMQLGNGKIARPPVPTYSSLESIMGLELNRVISGGSSTKDALGEMKTLFSNVLKGNFMIPYKLASFNDTLQATEVLIKSMA
jgi:multiple sugar transport system substrate-binding protein